MAEAATVKTQKKESDAVNVRTRIRASQYKPASGGMAVTILAHHLGLLVVGVLFLRRGHVRGVQISIHRRPL